MKNKSLLYLSLLLFSLSCKKDCLFCKPKLPPITRTGKGTFGCKVNGELWLPEGGKWNFEELKINYSKGYLNLRATKWVKGKNDKDGVFQSIFLEYYGYYSPGYYILSAYNNTGAQGIYSNSNTNCHSFTDTTGHQGFLHILRLDSAEKIISGVFEFRASSKDCAEINITEGRFDLKY